MLGDRLYMPGRVRFETIGRLKGQEAAAVIVAGVAAPDPADNPARPPTRADRAMFAAMTRATVRPRRPCRAGAPAADGRSGVRDRRERHRERRDGIAAGQRDPPAARDAAPLRTRGMGVADACRQGAPRRLPHRRAARQAALDGAALDRFTLIAAHIERGEYDGRIRDGHIRDGNIR